MKQEEYFGVGSIKSLPNILSKLNPKVIFLVTGNESYKNSGAENLLTVLLKEYIVFRYNKISEYPKLDDIEIGIEQYKNSNCDLVIAVGGGSVIDFAKLVNIFGSQHEMPLSYIEGKGKINNKGKKFIAIPTTSGSGSEATHFAVVYKQKEKFSVAHKFILPDVVIIDPQFTYNLSPQITATSGIDAFCQAIESYWCVNSTEESKKFSKESIRVILENLTPLVNTPNNDRRIKMSKAANFAGKAINITKTTAPHAISYSMTSYFGIPHGQAVSLTLGEFLIYNYEVTQNDLVDSRGVEYVRNSINELVNMLGCKNVYEGKNKISKLMNDIGLKTHLHELSISSDRDLKIIERNVNLERLMNNPRVIDKEALRKILRQIL